MSRGDETLLDLLKAARLVIEFMGGSGLPAFLRDLKTQSAVIHQLLLVGEAVKRLSSAFRSGHPGVPWKTIAGMRDKLIHQYDDVDLDEVWKTVSRDLPQLIAMLEQEAPPERPR